MTADFFSKKLFVLVIEIKVICSMDDQSRRSRLKKLYWILKVKAEICNKYSKKSRFPQQSDLISKITEMYKCERFFMHQWPRKHVTKNACKSFYTGCTAKRIAQPRFPEAFGTWNGYWRWLQGEWIADQRRFVHQNSKRSFLYEVYGSL